MTAFHIIATDLQYHHYFPPTFRQVLPKFSNRPKRASQTGGPRHHAGPGRNGTRGSLMARKKIALIGAGRIGGQAAPPPARQGLGEIFRLAIAEGTPQGKATQPTTPGPAAGFQQETRKGAEDEKGGGKG